MIKKELNLLEDVNLIALILVGRHLKRSIETPPPQREREEKRPPRKSFNEVAKIV
jgi:hypothetical protein